MSPCWGRHTECLQKASFGERTLKQVEARAGICPDLTWDRDLREGDNG